MERRIFLAVFLSFVVLYAFQALVPQPPAEAPPVPEATAPPPAGDAAPAGKADPPPSAESPAEAEAGRAPAVVSEAAERDVVIDTANVRAVFTNRGGRIKAWFLKHYDVDEEGTPVNLVPTDTPAGTPLPFSLRVDEGGLSSTLNNAIYRTSQSGSTITFEYEDASGLRVRKPRRLRRLPRRRPPRCRPNRRPGAHPRSCPRARSATSRSRPRTSAPCSPTAADASRPGS